MKLLRASCECGYHSRKCRSGYHFHQWWFPVINTLTGELNDVLCALSDEQVDLIQLSKVKAVELHQPFIEGETRQLSLYYADKADVVFNPGIGNIFTCPKCQKQSLCLSHVHVTAICKVDCGHQYSWPDSEEIGCPVCSYRPHYFEVDTELSINEHDRVTSYCGCSSALKSTSHTDAYCPKCGKLPSSYQKNGVSYCGKHHTTKLDYFAPRNFMYYLIEAPLDQFPNAKFWGNAENDDSIASKYCSKCETEHHTWLRINDKYFH
jgi:hypothetical protein